MHQDATWYGGRPQPRGLCVRWRPSPPANFSAHVYYSYCDFVRTLHNHYWFVQVQVLVFYAGWIEMVLRKEIGLCPGDFVLDGDPATLPQKGAESPSPIFSPFLLWPNGWMHQDGTWYGGRPQPRGLCVRWGPSLAANFLAHVYYSYCDFIRTLHNHYWFVQVQVLVFYAVLFLEKFNSTQSVPI